MARMKSTKLVLTFGSMTAAMAVEAALDGSSGRLIPVPGEIHAGCGLAWCADPDMEEAILEKMAEHHLVYESKHLIELSQ